MEFPRHTWWEAPGRFMQGILVILAAVTSLAFQQGAQAVPPLKVLETRPDAVVGEVMAIPILIPEGRWRSSLPEEVEFRLDDGQELEALVAWLGEPTPGDGRPYFRSWVSPSVPTMLTDPPTRIQERQVARGLLLCAMPAGYRGDIAFGRTTIQPRWHDAAPALVGPELPPDAGDGWPLLGDPGVWWRWCLLAELSGTTPPRPQGDERTRMLAHHIAGLWRAGLARLERVSSGTASEVRELLVARCSDEQGGLVATWVTDQIELKSLLDLMLDKERDDSLVVRSVLSFLDARMPVIIWTVLQTGDDVRVAIANPTDEEQVVRMQWVDGDPIPSAAVVPPGRIIEEQIRRPRQAGFVPGNIVARPLPNELIFKIGRLERRLHLQTDHLQARPPGVQFGPFMTPMTLAEAWSGVSIPPSPNWSTSGILRKKGVLWEVFLECFMEPGMDSLDQVEIHLGPPGAPVRVISVASDGSLRFQPGGGALRGAQAEVRQHLHRWRAVVMLDPALVAASGVKGRSGTLQVGMRRMLDGKPISVAGGAVPPWDPLPPIFTIDLSTWEDITASAVQGGVHHQALLYSEP